MLQEERFNKILEELAENGAVKNVDLSRSLGVSESTVVRFATELGFKGYPQFQKALGELVKQRLSSVQRISLAYERLSESPDLISSVLHNDIQNLKHTEEMIDRDAFYRAVDLIGDARKIYVIGGRSCSTLASFLNYYLSYIFDDVRLIRSDSVTESIEEIHRIGEQDVFSTLFSEDNTDRFIRQEP